VSRDGASVTVPDPSHASPPGDPIDLLRQWIRDASGERDTPQPMTLATVDAAGRPTTRTVLLKAVDERGDILFFTSYHSRKARDLERNPHASLLLWWGHLGRQVSISGTVQKASSALSDQAFAARTRDNQILTWAAEQSSSIPDRAYLEARCREVERTYAQREIPRPPHWGGLLVTPHIVELWTQDPDQLHDRLRFEKRADGRWHQERLAP
jgi:pyridoxamine 5'-phosphate oxidase